MCDLDLALPRYWSAKRVPASLPGECLKLDTGYWTAAVEHWKQCSNRILATVLLLPSEFLVSNGIDVNFIHNILCK